MRMDRRTLIGIVVGAAILVALAFAFWPRGDGADVAATSPPAATPPAAAPASPPADAAANPPPASPPAAPPAAAAKPTDKTYSVMDLAVAGPLGDKVMGAADAPVTIIEYASLTCSHCQQFHSATWPDLKAKYVDTGKVRFVYRDFPLNSVAAVASMVAHCVPEDRYFTMIDLMFEHQKEWAFVENPVRALFDLVKQTGFTQESFEACWQNQGRLDGVMAVRNRGEEKFGISGTPTFFINGIKKEGAIDLATIEATIGPMLK